MKINSIDVAVNAFTAISTSLLGIWLFFDSSIPVKYIYYPIAAGAVILAIGAFIEFIYITLRNIIRRK